MAREILVPFRGNDRIEEIIPYVEKIAQPGMRVVFLFHYSVDGFAEWLGTHWATMETGIQNPLAAQRLVQRYSWEGQHRLAREKIFPACEVLSRREVEVDAKIYSGSLRSAVRNYALRGDVHCVMMRAGIGLRITKILQGAIPIFGLFSRHGPSPVLLVHPGTLL